MSYLLSLLLVAGGTSAAQPANDNLQPPPGLVPMQGGRTKIGIDKKDVEKMLEENLALDDQRHGPRRGNPAAHRRSAPSSTSW
ncbi:MAG: hypothetical protein R3E96_16785 [Planctomycetota bacterium]